jgi:hypothetical protein
MPENPLHAAIAAELSRHATFDEGMAAVRRMLAEGGPTEPHGPGTELKSLLAGWPFRIVATPDCKCTSRAAYMDAKGCDWCESPEGMTEIMGFLREAAEERGLPFLDLPARLLVKRAISNARRKEAAANAQRPPHHDRRQEMAPQVHDAQG